MCTILCRHTEAVMPTGTMTVDDAQQELRRLRNEHAALLRRIQMLEQFINLGLELKGNKRPAAVTISQQIPMAASDAAAQSSEALLPIPVADQIAQILRRAGRPLHMKEIAAQLKTMRHMASKRPERTIWSAMQRRKGQFRKVRPNTFELAGTAQ